MQETIGPVGGSTESTGASQVLTIPRLFGCGCKYRPNLAATWPTASQRECTVGIEISNYLFDLKIGSGIWLNPDKYQHYNNLKFAVYVNRTQVVHRVEPLSSKGKRKSYTSQTGVQVLDGLYEVFLKTKHRSSCKALISKDMHVSSLCGPRRSSCYIVY